MLGLVVDILLTRNAPGVHPELSAEKVLSEQSNTKSPIAPGTAESQDIVAEEP
jgi:hypothetical protein